MSVECLYNCVYVVDVCDCDAIVDVCVDFVDVCVVIKGRSVGLVDKALGKGSTRAV